MLGGQGDLQLGLMHGGLDGAGGDVELDVHLRLVGPLERVGRIGALDREILHILRKNACRGLDVLFELQAGGDVTFLGHGTAFCLGAAALAMGLAHQVDLADASA
jgi:hypothetical protein